MINLSDREKENALNEVRILASIKHKNVAAYKQAFFDEPSSSLWQTSLKQTDYSNNDYSIVMEYADNGDVFQRICEHQQAGTTMKEKVIWKIFIQAVRGLKALHDLKILHRDMKSANIFLWKDYTAKLGDLNVSKVAKKGLLYTQTGTPYYASPEVWKDQPYDGKSDIWSLGCVLYETCALVPPFRADDMNGLFKKILKGQYPPIPNHYSMELRSVIKSLIQVNAASRPTCDQILEMGIVAKRARKYFHNEIPLRDIESESELLKTIKFSKNIFKLKLPQATYEQLSFATIPVHGSKQLSMGGKVRNNMSSKTQMVEKPHLPKITQSTRNGGNNHNNSSNSGDGDDEYEQDFENDERRNHHESKPKSRSYSGRREIEAKNYNKQKKQQLLEINSNIGNPQQTSNENLPLASNRSKQNLLEENNSSSQITLTQVQGKIPSPKSQEKRGLTQSPSHQVLQTTATDTQSSTQQTISQVTIVKPKKQISQKAQDNSTIQSTILEQENESEAIERLSRGENRKLATKMQRQSNHTAELIEKDKQDRLRIRENAQSMIDSSQQNQRSREDRKNLHMPSAKLDELPKVAQLSQSPSNMSLGSPEGSPLINHQNQQAKSLNPSTMNRNNIILKPQKNQQSPNFKRIVNIYSVNNYKKKKYIINDNNTSNYGIQNANQSQISLASQIYKGEDIKLKLQQLREGMGYYDGKSLGSLNNRDSSQEQISQYQQQHNNSVLLPELKSVTPQIQNVKNNYSMLNNGSQSYSNSGSVAKLANRKKSYERLMRVDQQSYHLYKHQNGKIEIQNPIRSGGINVYGLKQRPQGYYNVSANYSVLSNGGGGNSGLPSELDVQGKSVINSKQIINASYIQNNL
ncbi:protein kinase domain containing protein [Stylonychia lemnae]|uniref:non-specific serine/threonine protein kinase n=1 Tax=Stylonychia lemnae TaxID=5949 RepID=A0A078AB40_STYLE|nr:protein kinase domain containing protein [Stylonychia lemnae]|eukprot:CDW78008.1 protein kinase domain containing protein [Stylonychia lemnae]